MSQYGWNGLGAPDPMPYQQQQQAQAQQPPPQGPPPEPQRFVYRHPAPGEDQGLVPQFPQVASLADRYARKVPWYLWLGVGLWLGRRFLSKGRTFQL